MYNTGDGAYGVGGDDGDGMSIGIGSGVSGDFGGDGATGGEGHGEQTMVGLGEDGDCKGERCQDGCGGERRFDDGTGNGCVNCSGNAVVEKKFSCPRYLIK